MTLKEQMLSQRITEIYALKTAQYAKLKELNHEADIFTAAGNKPRRNRTLREMRAVRIRIDELRDELNDMKDARKAAKEELNRVDTDDYQVIRNGALVAAIREVIEDEDTRKTIFRVARRLTYKGVHDAQANNADRDDPDTTDHLLSTEANANDLRQSIEQYRAGKTVERSLIDPEPSREA